MLSCVNPDTRQSNEAKGRVGLYARQRCCRIALRRHPLFPPQKGTRISNALGRKLAPIGAPNPPFSSTGFLNLCGLGDLLFNNSRNPPNRTVRSASTLYPNSLPHEVELFRRNRRFNYCPGGAHVGCDSPANPSSLSSSREYPLNLGEGAGTKRSPSTFVVVSRIRSSRCLDSMACTSA